MKKLLVLLLIPFMFACKGGGGSVEVERLKAENDSLRKQGETKDQSINEFMAAFNEIQGNLSQIKEKEKIITTTSQTPGEKAPAQKEQISNDIVAIYELMQKNKTQITDMEKRLKGAGIKAKSLQKMIDNLNKQIEEKDKEIETLKNQMAQMNIDMEKLNTTISKISKNADSLNTENATKKKEIEAKTDELNTAYYVFGTAKELKTKNVITQQGGFVGLGKIAKLREDLNTSYFTKVNITDVKEIALGAKKAQVITSHPAGSYELVGKNGGEKIVIKDAKKFWSVSKYLVIVVD